MFHNLKRVGVDGTLFAIKYLLVDLWKANANQPEHTEEIMKIVFFESPLAFRNWLEINHKNETELLVGFYKINTGKPSITWSQSVDEALCFGWIDGIRKSIDTESYQIRFTPRKKTSIWSAVNIKKVELLTNLGLMKEAGLASFQFRTENKSRIYAHESEILDFYPEFINIFKSNKKAWEYFQELAFSYKKLATNWVMNAKQESTKLKRFRELVLESEAGVNRWKNNKYVK